LLKVDIRRVKTAAGTTYMLAPMYEVYMEGQRKEKLAKETSEKDAKEEVHQAPQATVSATAATGAQHATA
jgi:hypothetical protein